LYLVCARRIGQVGATDRPRPWSIKKTAKKSLGRCALPLRKSGERARTVAWDPSSQDGGARIRKDGPPTAEEEEALGPYDDGAAFRGGGRIQGSPGRLPAMERTRKAQRGGGLRRHLRRRRDRRPGLSPPRGAYRASDSGGHRRLRAGGGWCLGRGRIAGSGGQSPSGARLRQGHGEARQDRSDRRVDPGASPRPYGPLPSPFPIERSALCRP
jgi:hypothetical protein